MQFSQFGWCFKLFQFDLKVPKFPEKLNRQLLGILLECHCGFPLLLGSRFVTEMAFVWFGNTLRAHLFTAFLPPNFLFLILFAWKRQLVGFWNGRTSQSERITGWSLNPFSKGKLSGQAITHSCHPGAAGWPAFSLPERALSLQTLSQANLFAHKLLLFSIWSQQWERSLVYHTLKIFEEVRVWFI